MCACVCALKARNSMSWGQYVGKTICPIKHDNWCDSINFELQSKTNVLHFDENGLKCIFIAIECC